MVKARKKVYVGMSGGVDSSVSAALLKKAGFDVTGVFIKVWQPDWIECNWREERIEAMRAAAHLDIPFLTLDLESEYKKQVIDYMIDEYRAGRTPNPDVMCNRHVKFGGFLKWARENGADYVATGHYAINKQENGVFNLYAGSDKNKDQSYFLWTLKQDDLRSILFPVGEYSKDEVRRLARKFKLPNAGKKDSQGLCFIGKVDVKEFLSRYIESKPGIVIDDKGAPIGRHDGYVFYTIGERHGFHIDSKNKGTDDRSLYVIAKDASSNTITVSSKQPFTDSGVISNVCKVDNVNWISGKPGDVTLHARARYRAELQEIKMEGNTVTFLGKSNQVFAPGQSVVIYHGNKCLGGGIIK